MKTFERTGKRAGGRALAALVLVLGLAAAGCSAYSFSGATIPPEYETIAIVPVANETSTLDVDDLEDNLTDFFIDRFVRRTRLRLETNASNADVVLSGRITGFSEEAASIGSGNQGATRNEVSVRAAVEYRATATDSLLIDDVYVQAETYDLNAGAGRGIEAAALAAVENIAEAVFSDATSDW